MEPEEVVDNILGGSKKQAMYDCPNCLEKTYHWIKEDREICMQCGCRR